jgi:hypothetical protein
MKKGLSDFLEISPLASVFSGPPQKNGGLCGSPRAGDEGEVRTIGRYCLLCYLISNIRASAESFRVELFLKYF